MANGNGNITITRQVISGVVILILFGWAVWVSTGIINAQVREEKICTIQKSVAEIKGDVKELLKYRRGMDHGTLD